MGTKNNPGAYDCYANAHPDEPLFVLRGNDKDAPTLVWLWATLRELSGEDSAKVAEARACVEDMLTWQKQHNRKVSGLGSAVLAGSMELIRACNTLVKMANPHIPPGTTDDEMRVFLAMTRFEGIEEVEAAPAPGGDDCGALDDDGAAVVGAPALQEG